MCTVLRGQRPTYVVFSELFQNRTGRHYMKGMFKVAHSNASPMLMHVGVTVVQGDWLPRLVPSLAVFEKPVETPAPHYDAKVHLNMLQLVHAMIVFCQRDDVRCVMGCVFGKHLWPLPAQELSFPATPDRFRYFARFLLEGRVFPALARFEPHLKNRPHMLNKPWVKVGRAASCIGDTDARVQDRVTALLQPLIDGKIDCKLKLTAQWQADPNCGCDWDCDHCVTLTRSSAQRLLHVAGRRAPGRGQAAVATPARCGEDEEVEHTCVRPCVHVCGVAGAQMQIKKKSKNFTLHHQVRPAACHAHVHQAMTSSTWACHVT